MGEGSITIVELLRTLIDGRSPKDVKDIAFLGIGAARELIPYLDQIGFPAWDLFEVDRYQFGGGDSAPSVVYPLNGARGCPFQCTFCYHVSKDSVTANTQKRQ